MQPPPLPHVYPFRFVESTVQPGNARREGGEVSATVSGGQRAVSGGEWSSPFLLAEIIAQSALLLEGGDAEIGRTGFLAGVDNFVVHRPPAPGERLTVRIDLRATFGPFAKFAGVVSSEGGELASGEILVKRGSAPP